MTRSNIVMHSTTAATARGRLFAQALGRAWPQGVPSYPSVRALRADEHGSPFAHYRFQTVGHGKVLAYATGNCIRAGKHTHGDACAAAMRFARWMHLSTDRVAAPWVSAISTPNAVITGQLAAPVTSAFLADWSVTATDKFPGVAVSVPGLQGVTPEVFPKSGKFIVPGVRSPAELIAAVTHIDRLQSARTISSAPSEGDEAGVPQP